jgi:uncharacterized OB-fold protein
MSDRKTSPLGDKREHAVRCESCGINTYNLHRVCDRCLNKQEKENN